MNSVVVLYNSPKDPAAFDSYYVETHVPLAKKAPGLRSYTHGHCVAGDAEPAYYYFARLMFDSADDRAAAMASPEMAAAVADVPNFASGGATILTTDEIEAC